MISGFLNLASTNDGSTKKILVFAVADAAGGVETVTFQILDQAKTVQVNFDANQGQIVSVGHTACGKGLVTVTAAGSPQMSTRILDVDRQPGDDGSGG